MIKKYSLALSLGLFIGGNAMASEQQDKEEGKLLFNASFPKGTELLSIGYMGAQCDAVDFAKRFNLKLSFTGVGNCIGQTEGIGTATTSIYWPEIFNRTEAQVTDDILEKLQGPCDLIFISMNPLWSKYAPEVRNKILSKVKSGSILLIFSPEKAFLDGLNQELFQKLPAQTELFKALDKDDKFNPEIYRYGKGSIVISTQEIDYRYGFLFKMKNDYIYYEYQMARIARLSKSLLVQSQDLVKTAIATRTSLALDLLEGSKSKLQLALYDAEGNKEADIEQALDSTCETLSCKLPELPNGRHYLFAKIFDTDNQAIDWVASWIEVDNEADMESAVLDKTVVEKDEELALAITTKGNLINPEVSLSVTDTFGRLVLALPRMGMKSPVKFKVPALSCTVVNTITARLYSGGRLVDARNINFMIPANSRRKDFYFLAWNSAMGDSRRHTMTYAALAKAGVDGLANIPPVEASARSSALGNLLAIPYTTRFHGMTLDGHLFNDKWISDTEKTTRDTVSFFKPYGAFAFTLGDENYVSGFSANGRFVNSPIIWDAFQNYLKNIYASLEGLNKEWKSGYKKWKEISFTKESELLKRHGNPAAWVDFRNFVSNRFIQLQKDMRNIIKEQCPESFVGWDGAEQYSAYDGYNWLAYSTEFDLNNVYAFSLTEGGFSNKLFNGLCVSSFSQKDNLRGSWMNGIDAVYGPEYQPWNMFFNGFNSVWWWEANFVGSEPDALGVDLKPHGVFGSLAKYVEEIKAGPATLLKHARAVKSPVAVHYSVNNWYASSLSSGVGEHINNIGVNQNLWFLKEKPGHYIKATEDYKDMWRDASSNGHYASASSNALYLLRDLGLDPVAIADKQIEAGDLKNFQVLVLPYVEALSGKEVAAIRDFVADGGAVIADYRCAIRDEHCKFRISPALDDMFGIVQPDSFEVLKRRRNTVIEATVGARISSALFSITFSHPDLKLSGGKAYGVNDDGSPSFIVNSFGKGKTLYCNFDLYSYYNDRLNQQETKMRELFAGFLLDSSGLCMEPRVRLKNKHLASQFRLYKFIDGPALYAGLSRDYTAPNSQTETLAIPFDREGHIYEVRTKTYLGYGKSTEFTLPPGGVALFAILPSKPSIPKITGPSSSLAGTRVEFSLEAKTATAQPTTLVVSVYAPDGQKLDYLGKALYLPGGQSFFTLPLALNAQPGTWTLIADDAVSGLKAEHKILVKVQ